MLDNPASAAPTDSDAAPTPAPQNSAEALFWSDRPEPATSNPSNTEPDAWDEAESTPARVNRGAAPAMIWVGLAAIGVGFAATTCSYDDAVASGGGVYFVFYGPIVYGVISVLRGLVRL